MNLFNVYTKSKLLFGFFNNSFDQIFSSGNTLEIFEFLDFMMILYNFNWLRNQNQIQSVLKKVDVVFTSFSFKINEES